MESEITLEGLSSFGHYHIFAFTWWSDFYTGGFEYDRHSWGRTLGAQMDYVGEVLPVVILVQPAKTDLFGDPLTTAKRVVLGVGITPIGLRMMWRSDKSFKPYFIMKGGMLGFTRKALSNYASYQNFSLQIGLGMQIKLTDRYDTRVGYSDFHFSNAFMTPNNPGLDVMSHNAGIAYHLGKRVAR
ncbi:MAG TPA: acyloxyacyl hydrolase [Terracidiphilus sp.]|nr:acyloxyacyl hydrolase [Terracidiphilus sp.]